MHCAPIACYNLEHILYWCVMDVFNKRIARAQGGASWVCRADVEHCVDATYRVRDNIVCASPMQHTVVTADECVTILVLQLPIHILLSCATVVCTQHVCVSPLCSEVHTSVCSIAIFM